MLLRTTRVHLYRLRSYPLLLSLMFILSLEYNNWKQLLFPILAIIIFAFYFCLDHYKAIQETKWLPTLIKYISTLLSTAISIWLNIIANQQIVSDTGFSYTYFYSAQPLVFITLLIILMPLYILIIYAMGFFYDSSIFSNLKNKRCYTQALHSFFMRILISILVIGFYAKLDHSYQDHMLVMFREAFVYGAYQDIPKQCKNKHDIEHKYGENIQVTFVDRDILSIAIPTTEDNGKYLFSSDKCER